MRLTGIEKPKDSPINRSMLERLGLDVNIVPRKAIYCKLTLPPRGVIKLNVDGSLIRTIGGFGDMLRDEAGNVIFCYAGQCTAQSILKVEIKAIYEGCRVAKGGGVYQLRVLRKEETCPWYYLNEAQLTWDILEGMQMKEIQLVYRETNRGADSLASMGDPGIKVFIPPLNSELMKIIEEDRVGVIYTRWR
ncbi:hypothetical protein AQUCO_06500017v1 [Aquilegia coerulea]|uniref:RNase H type-1 domain-containing protein n=1 Tax=Aquilegia coerulea TaxID=218851 RepID=A0A2G5CC71_AQUCA|nr:hypothetical protein AQUCO_06500017v1 [Aquilegia coerulea]